MRPCVSTAHASSGRSVETSGKRCAWMRRWMPKPSTPRSSAAKRISRAASRSISTSLASRAPWVIDSPK